MDNMPAPPIEQSGVEAALDAATGKICRGGLDNPTVRQWYDRTAAEIFNLFNTTNFGQPDGNISNVTAGVISIADDERNIQFGIRLAS